MAIPYERRGPNGNQRISIGRAAGTEALAAGTASVDQATGGATGRAGGQTTAAPLPDLWRIPRHAGARVFDGRGFQTRRMASDRGRAEWRLNTLLIRTPRSGIWKAVRVWGQQQKRC